MNIPKSINVEISPVSYMLCQGKVKLSRHLQGRNILLTRSDSHLALRNLESRKNAVSTRSRIGGYRQSNSLKKK